MAIFAYKGRSARGELVTGRLEADSADAIAARLFTTGITPIEIAHAGQAGATLEDLWRKLGAGGPKTSDLVLFSRQMHTIVKSGIPLLRGLRGLASSTHNAVLRDALHDVLEGLESGRDLASSLGRHPKIFSTLYVAIVRVGEETGTLDQAFARLCDYLSLAQDIQDRVSSAMRYPLMVIGAVAVALAVISIFVIPNFAPVFRILGDDLPWATRAILGVSTYVRDQWTVSVGVLALLALGVRQYVRTPAGRHRWHSWKLRLPVMGRLAHEAILSRATRSLAIALKSGLPIIQTLGLIARTAGNDFMSERILKLRDSVERGESLSHAAATAGMFTPLVLQMMAVGEETGELADLLDEVADFYQREVEYSLKNLSSAIEPLLIVTVGAIVLVLALGVFLPMWDMISKVGVTG